MTIKEALEILQKEYRCRTISCPDSVLVTSCNGCEHYVDVDIVTEALKTILDAFGNCSELPNNSGDLISRQQALDVLHGYFDTMLMTDTWSPSDVYGLIDMLPSVQAERKKGHWIPVDDPSITGRCSVCGFETHLMEDDVYGYDYCPNCGARLEVIDE